MQQFNYDPGHIGSFSDLFCFYNPCLTMYTLWKTKKREFLLKMQNVLISFLSRKPTFVRWGEQGKVPMWPGPFYIPTVPTKHWFSAAKYDVRPDSFRSTYNAAAYSRSCDYQKRRFVGWSSAQ